MAIDVDVTVPCIGWTELIPTSEQLCQRAAGATLAAVPSPSARIEVSIVLADDRTIARLNREFGGREGATNVLSFPAMGEVGVPDTETMPLGDVIVAFETVCREARDQGKEPADHLVHLVVHGILHLLGYDHIDESEAEDMEALEVRILAALGIADPYAEEEASPA